MSFQAADLVVDPDEESSSLCDCCGHVARCIWGYIAKGDACVALYYVRWTVDRLEEHDPSFDLVLGPWGTTLRRMTAIASPSAIGCSFMVIDAHERRFVSEATAKTGLRRDEVIGTPLAPQVFALVDAIWLQDRRLVSSVAAGQENK